MVPDTVGFREDAEEEVPVVELQAILEQRRLLPDALDQLVPEGFVLFQRALPPDIAFSDRMITESPHEITDQRPGPRGPLARTSLGGRD
jgi:hypothetical protein